ncbi:MAG: hypothetical protein KDB27_14355 [Planctomycetales bacterium]|nr:hypothetical protein [Planctomycetales bacterium]
MNKMNVIRCTSVVACIIGVAHYGYGSPMVGVGDVFLLPNRSEQRVPLIVTGADAVQGLNLNVVVEGGGTDFGGAIGPKITAVDVTSETIFTSNNDGQTTIGAFDQAWVVATATASDTVNADGVLAWLTFDTTGFNDGTGPFTLSLSDPLGTPTDFAGIAADLQDGRIFVQVQVPETSSAGLPYVMIALLILRFSRRPAR